METKTAFSTLQRGLQMFAMGIIALGTLLLTGATIAAFAGVLNWAELPLSYNGAPVEGAGMIAQISLTALLLMLCLYLPSNMRVLNLENSHRNFQVRMEDVANAYWATHRADRTGIFKMQSEFDAVKERILWLRDHPDLHSLEPDVMEMAAQMSQQSSELARIYSDEKVARAKEFLEQRMDETRRLEGEIDNALSAIREVRQFAESVDMDETMLNARVDTLREELASLSEHVDLGDLTPDHADTKTPEVIFLPPSSANKPTPKPTHPGPMVAAE